jgi:hypothetical protein
MADFGKGVLIGLNAPACRKRPIPSRRELVTVQFGSKPPAYVLIEDGEVTHKSSVLDKYFWMAQPAAVIEKVARMDGVVSVTSKAF